MEKKSERDLRPITNGRASVNKYRLLDVMPEQLLCVLFDQPRDYLMNSSNRNSQFFKEPKDLAST